MNHPFEILKFDMYVSISYLDAYGCFLFHSKKVDIIWHLMLDAEKIAF
jgi:hypothetical protein